MKHLVLASALLSVIACGGTDDNASDANGGDHDVGTTGAEIALSPTEITIAPGSAGTVTIAITRGSAVQGETVNLTCLDVPAGITTTFDNVSTTADTATLTITVDASTPAGNATFEIQASDTTSVSTAPVHVTVSAAQPQGNTGRVIDLNTGQPVAGAAVSIWSAGAADPQTTATAADGSFTLGNVVAPYDVLVVEGQWVTTLFVGINTMTPVLNTILNLHESFHESTFTTVLTSGTDGDTTLALTDCANAIGDGNASQSHITFNALDTAEQSCNYAALQVHLTESVADGYGGYGTAALNVTPGEDPAALTVDMGSSLATRIINYNFGGGGNQFFLTWLFGNTAALGVQSSALATGGGSGTFIVPEDASITMNASFRHSDTDGVVTLYRTIPAGDDVTLDVPPLPHVVAINNPPNNGALEDATVIDLVGNANNTVNMFLIQDSMLATVAVVTSDPSITPAILRAHGVSLASNATYSMAAYEFGPSFAVGDDVSIATLLHTDGSYSANAGYITVTTPAD